MRRTLPPPPPGPSRSETFCCCSSYSRVSSDFISSVPQQTRPAAIRPLSRLKESAVDSYVYLLRRCAAEKSVHDARRIHAHMKETGFPHLSLGNKLVDAYLKCGCVDDARRVFDEMPKPHIVSWNSMVSSYIRHGRSRGAIRLYQRMLPEHVAADEFTFSSIFRAFSDEGLVTGGRGAHGRLVVSGLGEATSAFVGSALVNMYAKFGMLGEARMVYDRVLDKDVVLVTALITGYTQNGEDEEAIRVFLKMVNYGVKANEITYASVLAACGNLTELRKGTLIHCIIVKSGFDSSSSSQSSLLIMYSKCCLVDDSLKVFDQIVKPNLVAWTAAIGVLVYSHREETALSMFRSMLRDSSIDPNAFTLSSVLRACSSLAAFEPGKQIHALATKIGLNGKRFVGAALVDMYGKCGNVGMARSVFDSLVELDLVTVNSMISSYAQNGYGQEAVKLFDRMPSSGLEPNDATFTSVLSACSSAGLLEEGRRVFSSITDNYKNGPSKDHFACFIDLIGRVGRLAEAERLITAQVKDPDVILWRTLLGACKIHGEVEMAERAANKILELSPGDDGTYVLLSNIYASAGRWDEVMKMKVKMREMKLKKDPAMSWVEVDREVHAFTAGSRHVSSEGGGDLRGVGRID